MRGIPAFNFPAFDSAASELRQQGWEVISPASLDREHGFRADKYAPDYPFSASEIREFVRRDVDALLSLRHRAGDAIVLLPATAADKRGWAESVGARAEVGLAVWLGLDVYVYQWETRSLVPVNVTVTASATEKI